jgi:heme A synthase
MRSETRPRTPAVLPAFRHLAAATALAAYLLIIFGGVVKAYRAGLACPDWPLCYGQAIPALDPLVALEWGHRVGAALVTLLTGLTAFVGWRARPDLRRELALGLALLGVQVLLGGVTVWWRNAPAATAAHLGVATAFLAVWLLMAVRAGARAEARAPVQRPGVARLAAVAALAAWGLLLVGSYLKSSGGGLACPDLPLCQGRLLPPFPFWLTTLHWAHRAGAMGVGALVMGVAAQAWRVRAVRGGALLAAGLWLAQASLGISLVLLQLPQPLVALHLTMGVGLFGALVLTAASCPSFASRKPVGWFAGDGGR